MTLAGGCAWGPCGQKELAKTVFAQPPTRERLWNHGLEPGADCKLPLAR